MRVGESDGDVLVMIHGGTRSANNTHDSFPTQHRCNISPYAGTQIASIGATDSRNATILDKGHFARWAPPTEML
jgi:hypothetical protein